ncbi:dynein axonemal assembly factor 9 isoform X2 [Vanacampus margaritifer]
MAGIRRATGKYPGVNPAVSCCRLRQVQSLLGVGDTLSSDGILCSLGIDSRYNEGCTELAKYFFYGLYERSPINVEHSLVGCSEEMLDDVILLIKAECVHLYCNPLNLGYLLPYVSHWRNLHLYCMTEAEYEDEEAAEEFKISSFVTMVKDCQRIGVPYSSLGHVQKFDIFMVEKWPLIQAFALEGIGGGSFFTMKYKLSDMSERLWRLYSRLDSVSLDQLLAEDLRSFERQWSGFFSRMELESHLSILELSEAQAGEAFRTYFSHGLISSNIPDKSKDGQPFVLFGAHSSSEDMDGYSFNFPSESHQVGNTGLGGSLARHMILQCVAARGHLACSRTYFFGTTHTPFLGSQLAMTQKREVFLLSRVYSAAVRAVLGGIKCFSSTSSATKAQDVAEHAFLAALDSLDLSAYRSLLRSRCGFSIQAADKQGRLLPLTDAASRFVVKTASMTVRDVPDLQGHGGNLGSVVFSETFLDSSISIQHKDGAMTADSCYTVLTATVPRYACWMMESDVKQSELAQQLTKNEDDSCLGNALTYADGAYVLSSSHLSAPEDGKMAFFSGGLLFVHSQYGSITLSQEHISAIRFYDPDPDGVASLFVDYKSALLPHLPFPLHSTDHCLVFALQPRSKSYRGFYSRVLPVWKSAECGLTLHLVDQDQLTWSHKNMHSRLQQLHDGHEPPVAKRRGTLTTLHSHLPDQDMFLQHFSLSSIGEEPILSDHLGELFPSAELSVGSCNQGDKVVITVISGLPGSHKETLCHFLVRLNKEYGRWLVYPPTADACDGAFSGSGLQNFLSDVSASQKRRTAGKVRLLVLSPGYTDVLDLVQAVLQHPDPVVRARFTIGAVTACVDPLASCMEHRFAFPKLLEQCSQGMVSTVVFTGAAADQTHPLVRHVQQVVRAANPTAAFILAARGAVTRNEDVKLILSERCFSGPQMLRARYVLYPGWCNGRFRCGFGSLVLSQHRVAFSRPLERLLFVARCKALKASLRPSPFKGNVYNVWGKVRFSDSPHATEVSYSAASGDLRVVPEQKSEPKSDASCFLVFDGVGLTEDVLKDWLRLCTKQMQTKTPKTEKMLSPDEMKNIHTSRHLDPLPPGFFYNGFQYVNMFGEKRDCHPNMHQFVEEYVAEANKRIEMFNRRLELQADLFDP